MEFLILSALFSIISPDNLKKAVNWLRDSLVVIEDGKCDDFLIIKKRAFYRIFLMFNMSMILIMFMTVLVISFLRLGLQ